MSSAGEAWADVSYGGRVRVEGAFSTLKSDAALLADAGSPQAVLAALVDQAYGLPTEGLGQAAVRVTVAGQERTTKAVPLWIQVPVKGPGAGAGARSARDAIRKSWTRLRRDGRRWVRTCHSRLAGKLVLSRNRHRTNGHSVIPAPCTTRTQ